jgi:uncharacterized membrane protein YgaE (UPF0421/DUF939 family)
LEVFAMRLRSVVLLFILLAITALAVLNWATLTTPSQVSLGLMVMEAPLGLIMLTLTALMSIFFLAYVLSLHGSVLLETRRHTKEMQAQRELADKAEASRFTELRNYLETHHQQAQAQLLARIDSLQSHLDARATESDNSTAAYVGQLEQQLRMVPVSPSRLNP